MLQRLANMFFSRDKETIEEIPVEVLHKTKQQRKKKQSNETLAKEQNLHTTESIISNKVKKYLCKLFGGSRFKAILDSSISSRSSSFYQQAKDVKIRKCTEDLEEFRNPVIIERKAPIPRCYINKKQEKFNKSVRLSTSFRKSLVQKKILKANLDSLNNLFNPSSTYTLTNESDLKIQRKIKFLEDKHEPSSLKISNSVLKDLKSNSFCEVVDQLIKKQKKKQTRSTKRAAKKLKKTTKSSISTMCERAKLLLNGGGCGGGGLGGGGSFAEETEATGNSIDDNLLSEDKEEILTIHDLNNFDPLKSSEESIKVCKNKSLESVEFYSKCSTKFKCTGKISSCMNLHHSSRLERPWCYQDFETDLEIWTADYINGLVAANEPKHEVFQTPGIPIKKKSKNPKTKSKKYIKCDVNNLANDDVRILTDFRQHSHLLGGVKMMEGHPQKYTWSPKECPKVKSRSRKGNVNMCQKIQDIQNYIDNLIFPEDEMMHQRASRYLGEVCEPGLPKTVPKTSPVCPEKQSIQELKKFQRELKQRIKDLEKKMPSTSSAATKHCFFGAKKYPKDICRRCNKKVYLVEKFCAGDGVYHNFCYTCYCCKRSLNSLNLCVTRGEIFCKQCFQKYFGPDIYGFVK